MMRERGATAFATVDDGADFNVLEVGRANSQAYDPGTRALLRELSLALTGLD